MADLTDIDGIGNTTEQKLNQIGIETINELANADLSDIEDADIRSAEQIHDRAQKRGIRSKTGLEVLEEQEDTEHIPTGVERFDNEIDGGLEPGFLFGVSGEHQAGKTQLIFQSLVSAAEETGDHVIYIETEPNRFQTDRIRSIATDDDVLERIHKIEAYDSDESVDNLKVQYLAYNAVRETFDDVALIAVDSFVANFRLSQRFEGRSDLKERSNLISKHLSRLQSVASDLDCPVMMSLQIYGNPKQYDSHVPIWGGNLMHHTLTALIHMSHGKGQLRELHLKGHPGVADSETIVKITENGVESN